MMIDKSAFERFLEQPENRLLFAQEELIVNVSELIAQALKRSGHSRSELAAKLGKSKAYVTQLLRGGGNPTLRTIAAVFTALDHNVKVMAVPKQFSFSDTSYSNRWNREVAAVACGQSLTEKYQQTDNPKVVELLNSAA